MVLFDIKYTSVESEKQTVEWNFLDTLVTLLIIAKITANHDVKTDKFMTFRLTVAVNLFYITSF